MDEHVNCHAVKHGHSNHYGNVSLGPVTWWRMTPSLNVLDGGKKGVLPNMLFGWGKWLRLFGPLGTPKGMDDPAVSYLWVVSPC
jgi:hypothetical protein